MAVKEAVTGLLATVAGLVAVIVHYVRASGELREAPLIIALAGSVTIGFAVLVFGGAVPRARRRDGPGGATAETALLSSAIGFLSVATAWTGLPFVLGAGGATLGRIAARRADTAGQRGMATASIALGLAAIVLGCVTVAAA